MRTTILFSLLTATLLISGINVAQSQSPATAPAERSRNNPFAGKIVVITLRSDTETSTTLENAAVRSIGNRNFIVGDCICASNEEDWREDLTVWINIEDISEIVEVPSRRELNKRSQDEIQPEHTHGV